MCGVWGGMMCGVWGCDVWSMWRCDVWSVWIEYVDVWSMWGWSMGYVVMCGVCVCMRM